MILYVLRKIIEEVSPETANADLPSWMGIIIGMVVVILILAIIAIIIIY